MQLTIVPRDNLVIIDQRAARIDLSKREEFKDIHAVKWDDAVKWDNAGGFGYIEFHNSGMLADQRMFRLPQRITDLAPFQSIIDEHRKFVAAQDAELKRGEERK